MSTAILRFGPIWLQPGIRPRNVLAFLYAAFFTIGLIASAGFLQPYLLTENLQMPASDQGRASSLLSVSYEIVVLLAVGPLGALADRIGRRPIFVLGFVWLSAAFVLFPMVTSLAQLVACRVFFGVGAACCSCMMATVMADLPQDRSRGMMAAAAGVGNGLGVVLLVLLLSSLPTRFTELGYDPLWSGRLTYWVGATLAFISALVVWRGLKAGKPGKPKDRESLRQLLSEGVGAARKNPRIMLVCAEAFVARGDLVVFAIFLTLWAQQAGLASGMSLEEAVAAAGKLVALVGAANLFWAPVWGIVLDRVDRATAVAIAMGVAATAYLLVGFAEDPLASAFIPLAILLGVGECCAILSGAALVGQEAPRDIRGSVFGLFNFCGSMGILSISLVGGILFDIWMPGAPFVVVGIINGLIMVAAIFVRIRTGYRSPAGVHAAEEAAG